MRYGVERLLDVLGFRPAVSIEQGLADWAAIPRLELARSVAW